MRSGIEISLDELLQLRHKILSIDIAQNKKMATQQQGQYLSLQRGRGMDFAETRAYHPGDDIRTMNWRVTAKTGEPHTKVYQQERERPVYIIVDYSASMFFGTKVAFKSVIAAQVAALIAWSAVHQRDRIGGIVFNAEKEIMIQPKTNSHGVVAFLKQLVEMAQKPLAFKKQQNERLLNAVKKIRRITKSGSVIYLISDFYQYSKELEKELQYLSKYHEVINIFIYDQLESHAPFPPDDYVFHGYANESLLLDTRDPGLCAKYSLIFNQRLEYLQKLQMNFGIHLIDMQTGDDVSQVLQTKIKMRN